jgi:REase_DpnII-MboI
VTSPPSAALARVVRATPMSWVVWLRVVALHGCGIGRALHCAAGWRHHGLTPRTTAPRCRRLPLRVAVSRGGARAGQRACPPKLGHLSRSLRNGSALPGVPRTVRGTRSCGVRRRGRIRRPDSVPRDLDVFFDDVRAEDFVPQRAGSRSRLDFLLKAERIVVESKMTQSGLGARAVALVYDPDQLIANRGALEQGANGSRWRDSHRLPRRQRTVGAFGGAPWSAGEEAERRGAGAAPASSRAAIRDVVTPQRGTERAIDARPSAAPARVLREPLRPASPRRARGRAEDGDVTERCPSQPRRRCPPTHPARNPAQP